jgi:hypothetical protein
LPSISRPWATIKFKAGLGRQTDGQSAVSCRAQLHKYHAQ